MKKIEYIKYIILKQSINIFKFKNKRISNKITIKTKRTELGRKRKKDTIKGIHTMHSAMFLNKNNQKGYT